MGKGTSVMWRVYSVDYSSTYSILPTAQSFNDLRCTRYWRNRTPLEDGLLNHPLSARQKDDERNKSRE